MKKQILTAVLIGGFLASCSANRNVSPTSSKLVLKATPENLQQGQSTFETSCATCHKLPNPAKHDAAGWAKTLASMAPKANLTEHQTALVYTYLINASK